MVKKSLEACCFCSLERCKIPKHFSGNTNFKRLLLDLLNIEGCVCYFLASLLFKSKLQHLLNQEKCFLIHLKSSFRSRENQTLEFQIFKFHDIIKCHSIKQEIHFTIVTRNGQPGNTDRLNRNLYVMLKFTEQPKTLGMTSKKKQCFS